MNRHMKHIARVFAGVWLSLAVSFPVFAAEGIVPGTIHANKVAAVVNGEMITMHELRRNVMPELSRAGVNPNNPADASRLEQIMHQVLSLMINDALLRQEADRLKVTVNESEVENELRKLVQRSQTTMQEFETRLVAQGGSLSVLKDRLRDSILSQRIVTMMISRKVVVTKEEIEKYYEENKADFLAERSVNLNLIIFAPTSDVDSIAAQIKNGRLDFAQAARQYSIGPAADQGGGLGNIPLKDLSSAIRAEVMHTKEGHVSDVFMLDANRVMIRVNSSTPGKQMTLEEATPEIDLLLREPRLQERFAEYTKQLRNKAVVDIRI